jgi:hypothetical protein
VGVPGGCSSPAKRPTKASAPGAAAARQSSESERVAGERERGMQMQRTEGEDGGKKKNARSSLGVFSVSLKNSVFLFFFLSLLI